MRSALLLLALASSCATGQSTRDLLTPDQLHLYYTLGSGESSGSISGGPGSDPWNWGTSGDTDYSAITAGLSWNLTRQGESDAMRRALRQLTIATRLLAANVQPPEPVEPPPVTLQLPPLLEEYLVRATVARPAAVAPVLAPSTTTVITPAAPDISITLQGGDQVATTTQTSPDPAPAAPAVPAGGSDDPQGVLLLGLSNEVWMQIIGVLTILATALGTYLGRERVPVLKHYTKKGKADKAAKEAEKEGPVEG